MSMAEGLRLTNKYLAEIIRLCVVGERDQVPYVLANMNDIPCGECIEAFVWFFGFNPAGKTEGLGEERKVLRGMGAGIQKTGHITLRCLLSRPTA